MTTLRPNLAPWLLQDKTINSSANLYITSQLRGNFYREGFVPSLARLVSQTISLPPAL